ncbi:hypothetical protein LMH87_001663 [Akanthomyces muscarius]|uniref:Amine oxidase domain-containing protein n=1 Tax=Akanthomyces muscarius TaxID=2231603 RepID=A0A9W8Q782_AKAMU|nr:hypothetical protein LMH87_001663 [Akanthomyces muscarius]KAJ4147116.1 hypothetical protein LMH87_001663 [Akanthomyces muscarius]
MVANNTNAPLRVAVVGAGVVGLALTAGLLAHGIDVVLYEHATTLKEIGTGIGLLPTAVTAIEALSPSMAEAMKRISFQLSFRLGVVNSASNEDLSLRQEGGLYDLVVPDEQGRTMHTMARAALATTLLDHVPKERLKLGKKVVNVVSTSASDPVRLVFADGTTAEADAVVACDSAKSRIRRVMLGDAHPGSLCQYAHEVCYRALVDSSALRSILGPLADVTAIYLAPGAYLIVYPVGVRANISVYVHDASHSPPPASQSHGRVAPRAELATVLSKLGPNIRAIADILPEEVSVWALHDLLEHPLATLHDTA